MDKKIKIYLCDFVHNYLGAGTYMFPLNIGYISAYLNKTLSDKIEVKLFKYPDVFLKAMESGHPEIVGFSNYTWNSDLNNQVSKVLKSKYPKSVVIFGGPNIDYEPEYVAKFFVEHPAADFYVPFQGETPSLNLVKKLIENGLDADKTKIEPIDGVFHYDKKADKAVIGNPLTRIKNPDDIPSPYLTGVLDEFFNDRLIPIIETNRGCPYQCTFCCQAFSAHRQINFFSMERVQQELDYVASHVKNTDLLNLADSNFGIIDRDMDIAKYIHQLEEKTGYPHKVSSNLAKNQPKIYEISKILNNLNLIVSLQSLDTEVLKRIKRSNIDMNVFKDIIDKVNASGAISGTEIILGLPSETKESHLKGLRTLFDWNVSYIICYNCLILPGSEMSFFRNKEQFKCKTKFRLTDSAFGKYGSITSFEVEEGIRSTDTMNEEELLSFRPIHWLIQFLWNYRFYYDFLKQIQILGINPLEYIIAVISDSQKTQKKVEDLFTEFGNEAITEWFETPEELSRHYSSPENFKKLEGGEYGKMNGKYTFKVLYEMKKEFENHLFNSAVDNFQVIGQNKEMMEDLLKFQSEAAIDLHELWGGLRKEKIVKFKYNFVEWRNSAYKKDLKEFYSQRGTVIRFYINETQEASLHKLLKQYAHNNRNVTLRKMSENMSIRDFLYNLEVIEGSEGNKTGGRPSYKDTKSAPNLKEIIIKDPNEILHKKLGKWYADYRIRWKEAEERRDASAFPIHLDIDITDACNLACKYCLQSTHIGWTGKKMDKETFAKILDEADRENACSLNIGWNCESILDKELFMACLDELERHKPKDVFVHTNAVNLTEEVQKKIIKSKISTMCFSLGAVNDDTRKDKIEKIKEHIISFRKLRDEAGQETPIIRISIVPMESNIKEIPEYVEFWKKYADYIELQSMAGLENKTGANTLPGSFCADPWRRLSITPQGDIYPCCGFTVFSKALKLGNISDMTLKDAWNSEKINDLRGRLKSNNNLYPGCKQCLSKSGHA